MKTEKGIKELICILIHKEFEELELNPFMVASISFKIVNILTKEGNLRVNDNICMDFDKYQLAEIKQWGLAFDDRQKNDLSIEDKITCFIELND